MPETKTFTCNLCDAMCGLHVTVDGGRITDIRGNPGDVFSRGHICPKGPALKELYEDPDRLRTPMRRAASGFKPISWEEAMTEVAARLRAVRDAHGKDAVAYYVGNPVAHSYRAALGSQALQMALGTRSRFDANSQDGNPRIFTSMLMYGDILAMPVPDIDRTDLLVILGANPAVSNGSMMGLGDVRARLKGVRGRGGRVVVFDPRRTETVDAYATEHHAIRPGGDAAMLLAMLHVLFAERRVDERALDSVAVGLDPLAKAARPWSPERVAPAIGVPAEVIRSLARDLASTPRAAVYSRVGTCQSEFGPLVCWLVEALNIVTGHFDREGGVLFPRPAADVGGLARLLLGTEYGRWRSRVRGLPELIGALPSAVLAEEMDTPGEGQLRALVCVAGNPVLSTPNGPRLARAIAGLDFVVAVDLYLNETSRLADIVLPPAHVFETGNYDLLLLPLAVRNLAKVSPPILERAKGTRDDWQILAELAWRVAGPRVGLRAWMRLAERIPDRLLDLMLRLGPYPLTLARLRAAPDGIDLGPLEPTHASACDSPAAARCSRPSRSSRICLGCTRGSRRSGRRSCSSAAGTCAATTRGATTCRRSVAARIARCCSCTRATWRGSVSRPERG